MTKVTKVHSENLCIDKATELKTHDSVSFAAELDNTQRGPKSWQFWNRNSWTWFRLVDQHLKEATVVYRVMFFWTLDGLLSTMQEQSLMSECCLLPYVEKKKTVSKTHTLVSIEVTFTKQQSADTEVIFLTDPKPQSQPQPPNRPTQPPVDSPMPKVLDSFPKIDGGLGQPAGGRTVGFPGTP